MVVGRHHILPVMDANTTYRVIRRLLRVGSVVVVSVLWAVAACTPAPAVADDAAVAAAARTILDAYHAADPQPADRRLHVISWRTQDRDFPTGHRERLDRILTHIERFYADEMERLGLGRRSIRPARDKQGRLVVHEVVGEGRSADYGKPDGDRIRKECVPVLRAAGIDLDRETVMIFTNLASWDPKKLSFVHTSPYYAGGDHRGGTAYQLDSPELDARNLSRKTPMITDGEYGRISLGKHNSIFIGGIAHELGHALGLPHCRATGAQARAHGTALMGAGNMTYAEQARGEGKGSFLTLADGLRLAAHPQFSGSIKGLQERPSASLADASAAPSADGASFTVTARVAGTPPVHAMVAYLDPEGGGDYDARTAAAAVAPDGRFTLLCDAVVPGKAAALRIVACHANGATTIWSHAYSVAADGTIDIDALRLGFELEPFLAAIDRGDTRRAEAARDALPADGRAARIAATILAARSADRKTVSPADVPADEKSLPLSAARPAAEKVGWLRPAYDHLPRREALLASAGRVFDGGIYAHAPAAHRYDLGGRWERLTGSCGIPTQPGGSVVFVIRADGREIFRSKRLGPDRLEPFDLDISGVRELVLETEDGGDGRTADWGTWFDPRLTRR